MELTEVPQYSPKELVQVFDRFYRADKSGQITGSGLGTSIVKEIIVGKGTRISLSLPQAQPK